MLLKQMLIISGALMFASVFLLHINEKRWTPYKVMALVLGILGCYMGFRYLP